MYMTSQQRFNTMNTPRWQGAASITPRAGVANITTSITPQSVYTPQQTAYKRNDAVATALAGTNPYEVQKAFTRPGMSRGAGTTRQAQPAMMQGRAQAAEASAMVPFADEAMNARNILQGQVARENEAQALTGLNMGMQDLYSQQNLVNQNNALNLYRALLGF